LSGTPPTLAIRSRAPNTQVYWSAFERFWALLSPKVPLFLAVQACKSRRGQARPWRLPAPKRFAGFVRERDAPLRISTADSKRVHTCEVCHSVLQVGTEVFPVQANVLPAMLEGVDLILGMDWLLHNNAVLDCESEVVSIKRTGRQVRLFQTVKSAPSGVAAVQSLPTLLTAKQAATALYQGAASWLMVVKPDGGACADVTAAAAAPSSVPANGQGGPGLLSEDEVRRIQAEFRDVFEAKPKCPPYRFDLSHTIRLQPGSAPTFHRPYRLSHVEKAEVEKQVAGLLQKGLIEPSASPYGAPVLFVVKKDGSLRMCIDYRALNKITARDRFPLPRIDELLDQLHAATVFSSLGLQSGYHQLRIRDEDKDKTAMVTHLGQFQFKVLCFGLTNAPTTFQHVMNRIFERFIGRFVLVYIDDILVFSRTAAEHARQLRQVLQVLREHQLTCKLAKCEFNRPELRFLGHIVGRNGVAVDSKKIAVIEKWPTPANLKELQSFLGLANYFRRFVPHYSTIAAPLTALTGKRGAESAWKEWEPSEHQAFAELKRVLTTAPVLAIPDLNGRFQVFTDASGLGTGGMLLQCGRVIAYTSAKFSPAEFNYVTGEQELLALYRALQVWRCYLEGSHEAELLTDHNPLTYLQTQPMLSRRQARWMEFF